MSNTIVCEILEYENILREGGIPEKQIKAQVKALAQIVESNLATKHDISLVQKDIEMVRKDMEKMELKIILSLIVLIPAIIKILEHFKI